MTVVLAYVLGAIPFGYLLVKWKTGARRAGVGQRQYRRDQCAADDRAGGGRRHAAAGFRQGLPGRVAGGRGSRAAAPVLDERGGAGGHGGPRLSGIPAVSRRQGGGQLRWRFPVLTPLPLVAVMVVFVGVVAVTRYISMGSIVAAATFPFGVWLIQQRPRAHPSARGCGGALGALHYLQA